MSTEDVIEESSSSGFDHLMLQIDAVCLKFEAEWAPESALAQVTGLLTEFKSEKAKSRLFRELVATDCELRTRRRLDLIPDSFADVFPRYAKEVQGAVSLWKETEFAFLREQNQARFDSLPERIGEFTIVREVGRGGSSVVFEAIQPELDRRVALKTFVLNPVRSLEQRQRFALEVKAASLLEHENIVAVYVSGESEGLLYYAMQFVDGVSLHHLVNQHADPDAENGSGIPGWKLDSFQAAKIIAQATSALEYAHQQGVLHRDVKPSNLLLDKSGNVRLTDFGLAQLAGSDSQLTATGNVVGSLRYLPPEAFDGVRDARSDVYGLGLTLYELLTLQPAFPEKDRSKLIPRIQEFDVRSPRQIDKTIPRDLETITMKAMAPDSSDRYASAREFGDDLQRFLAGEPILARPVTWIERTSKWLRRRPGVTALSATVGVLLILGIPAFLLMWQGRELDRVRTKNELAEVELREKRASADAEWEHARAEGAAEARADAEYAMLINSVQRAIDAGEAWTAGERLFQFEYELEEAKAAGRNVTDRRGWEWHHLKGLLNQATISIVDQGLEVSALRFSPNEEKFVFVGQYVVNEQLVGAAVKLRDTATGDLVKTIANGKEVFADAAFCPDGSTLATISLHSEESGFTGWVRLWDVDSGKELQSRKLVDDFPKKVLEHHGIKRKLPQISFESSGKLLVTSSPVIAFDSATLEPKWKQEGDRFFADRGAITIFKQDAARRHDVKTGEPLSESTKSIFPTDFCLQPNGEQSLQVCQGRDNMSLCVSRDSELQESGTFSVPRSYWTSFAPDGQSIVRSEIDGDLVFQAPKGESSVIRRLVGHMFPVHQGAFTRAGDRLITASRNGTIKIWDLNSINDNKVAFDIPDARGDAVESLAFNPTGNRIHFASSNYRLRPFSGSAQIDGTNLMTLSLDTTNCIFWPRHDISYSPDGSLLAAPAKEDSRPESSKQLVRASASGRIHVWVTETNEILKTIEIGNENSITATAISQDNQSLAIAVLSHPEDGEPEKYTPRIGVVSVAESSKSIVRWLPIETEMVGCLKFIRNDEWLAVADNYGGVVLCPIKGDQETERLAESRLSGSVGGAVIDVDPSGTLLAAARVQEQLVRVYDIPSKMLKYESNLAISPCSIRFSPEGERLAVAGQRSIVRLLATESGHTLLTLDGRSDLLGASPGTSIKVVFSPDGRRIATQALDGRITVWTGSKE